jgi:hypothetical protein
MSHCRETRLFSVSLESGNGRRGEREKATGVIVSLKNGHDFAYSSLEEREMMLTWPEESFSIIN